METVQSMFGILLLIPMILLTVFYFKLYHSIFSVVYFRNTCLEIIFEVIGCFVLAMVTVGFAGKIIVVVFGAAVKIIAVILKIALVISVIAVVAYFLYSLIHKTTDSETEIISETAVSMENRKDTSSKDMIICRTCGAECKLDDVFCGNCGTLLGKVEENEEE